MTSRVVLIGCGASKLDVAAPAADLYVGNLFRARRAYAEAQGVPWAILSAKLGLVMPDKIVEPYDERMESKNPADARRWGLMRSSELCRWLLTVGAGVMVPPADPAKGFSQFVPTCAEGLTIEVHAGKAYVEPLTYGIEWGKGDPLGALSLPMRGLGVGQQLGWYKQRRDATPNEIPAPTDEEMRLFQ